MFVATVIYSYSSLLFLCLSDPATTAPSRPSISRYHPFARPLPFCSRSSHEKKNKLCAPPSTVPITRPPLPLLPRSLTPLHPLRPQGTSIRRSCNHRVASHHLSPSSPRCTSLFLQTRSSWTYRPVHADVGRAASLLLVGCLCDHMVLQLDRCLSNVEPLSPPSHARFPCQPATFTHGRRQRHACPLAYTHRYQW